MDDTIDLTRDDPGIRIGRSLRVGVVGCGYWGAKHVRTLQGIPGVETVAIIDSDENACRSVSAQYPRLPTFSDLESALPAIDAVVVATRPKSHAELALQALRNGKHVLVEKPMTTSSMDAAALIDEAEQNALTLMVGHTFEYNAAVWRLREAVQSGALGDIYYVDTARLNLGLYQADVNVIWDLAPHDISIINYVLGSRPTEVRAVGHKFAEGHFEDVAFLSLKYGDIGVEAQVHVSWLDPCKVRRVTVVGEQKMAVYNDIATEEKIRIYDKGVSRTPEPANGSVPMTYRYGSIMSPYIDFKEPLRVEDEHFIHCTVTGERPRTDGRSGLEVVATLEAAEQALRDDRAVRLDRPGGPRGDGRMDEFAEPLGT